MLAGFILNFMPCVLPVIGLKLLSFLEQGGKNPGRVLMLNVWYTLGILSAYPLPTNIPNQRISTTPPPSPLPHPPPWQNHPR
jgi:hypothetical protein